MAQDAGEISRQPHHNKGEVCSTRAKYRDGRQATAVKVYTINQESCFLLIQNVPTVGAGEDLKALCEQYGMLESIQPLDEYPGEQFTETYLVKYDNFFAARTAKKQLDDRSFFGGVLHVCYAPEFETVEDTKKKLIERRKHIANKTRPVQQNEGNTLTQYKSPQKRKDYLDTALSNTNQAKRQKSDTQFTTYIWAGKEYTVPVISSADNQREHIEHKVEVAITYEDHMQKQSAKFRTQDSAQQQDISSSSGFTEQNVQSTDFQHFIPRQLSRTSGQSSSKTKPLDENKTQSYKTNKGLENANAKDGNYSYEETMNDIRKKLSSFSGANLTVNLKGKR